MSPVFFNQFYCFMKVLQHQSNPNTSKRSGFNLVSNQDKTEKDNKIPLRLIGLESLTQYYQMSLLNICTNTLPPSADGSNLHQTEVCKHTLKTSIVLTTVNFLTFFSLHRLYYQVSALHFVFICMYLF